MTLTRSWVLLTPPAYAKKMGVNRSTITRHVREGKLAAIKERPGGRAWILGTMETTRMASDASPG